VTGVSLGDGVDGETSDGSDGGLVDFSKGRHGLPWRGARRMDGLEISWQLRHTRRLKSERTDGMREGEERGGWKERRRQPARPNRNIRGSSFPTLCPSLNLPLVTSTSSSPHQATSGARYARASLDQALEPEWLTVSVRDPEKVFLPCRPLPRAQHSTAGDKIV
jgi:hypothetical protein